MNKGIDNIKNQIILDFNKELMLFKMDSSDKKILARLVWLFDQLPQKIRNEKEQEFEELTDGYY